MSSESTTMIAVLLIVGLVIGAGIGYFMAPTYEAPPPEQPLIPQAPAPKEHSHLGIWLVIILFCGVYMWDFGVKRRFGVG